MTFMDVYSMTSTKINEADELILNQSDNLVKEIISSLTLLKDRKYSDYDLLRFASRDLKEMSRILTPHLLEEQKKAYEEEKEISESFLVMFEDCEDTPEKRVAVASIKACMK